MSRRSVTRTALWMLLGGILAGAASVAPAQASPKKQIAQPGRSVVVPDVVGMKEPQARATLSRAGLRMRRGSDTTTDVTSRNLTVAEQAPAAGESLERGRGVVAILYVYKVPPSQTGR